jgi:hypothetical protein
MLSTESILLRRAKTLTLVEEEIDSNLQRHFGGGQIDKMDFGLDKYKLTEAELSGLMNKYAMGGWCVKYEHGYDQRDGGWSYIQFNLIAPKT